MWHLIGGGRGGERLHVTCEERCVVKRLAEKRLEHWHVPGFKGLSGRRAEQAAWQQGSMIEPSNVAPKFNHFHNKCAEFH